MTIEQGSESRGLFGGAITATFPAGLIDASDLRQIPDNQEVLLWRDSDVTCIVEVLEAVQESGTEAAARFHFSSLAHDNDATSSQVLSVEAASTSNNNNDDSRTPAPTILKGTQTVRKFNKDDAPLDVVLIHVAVWRLAPTKDVDLVMSWNEPVAQAGAGGQESQTSTAEAAATGGSVPGDHKVATAFERAARTLSIADWGLFA
ncbi:unnamed protein product [Jaminaea pallidilutea]